MSLGGQFFAVHCCSLGQMYLPNFIEIGRAIFLPGKWTNIEDKHLYQYTSERKTMNMDCVQRLPEIH